MQLFEYNQVTCLHPRVIRNRYTGELMSVPCGKCSPCLVSKSSLWASRCMEESTCHTYTLFGTLTYTDDHLPKIDINSLDEKFLTDSMCDAIDKSKDYIDFCHGQIPVLNIKDIQNFFKRLRSYIDYNHGTKIQIRYFLAGDIGCTTIRPHYHYLLWFDSHELAKVIKEYIYKAWKPCNSATSISQFFKRNKHRFIHGQAERYVAGYINRYANLPPIFAEKPFKPWHTQSSQPPIGTVRILKESLDALLNGDVGKVTLHRLSSGQSVVIPLWRGLENRFFPKCLGFGRISHRDRVTLYSLYDECAECIGRRPDFADFEKWFNNSWNTALSSFPLFQKLVFSEEPTRISFDTKSSCFVMSSYDYERYSHALQRLFSVSRLVSVLSVSVSLEVSDYVCRIEEYYSRKEYNSLVVQLKFQQKLSNNPRCDVDLRYYPYIVDSLFYENERRLQSSDYLEYLEQFGLQLESSCFFVPQFSVPYIQKKVLFDKMLEDGTKKKLNKEYIANHPECYQNYKSLLRPVSLIS